jgi:hypothetical protein
MTLSIRPSYRSMAISCPILVIVAALVVSNYYLDSGTYFDCRNFWLQVSVGARFSALVTLFALPTTWFYGIRNRAAPKWIVLSGLLGFIPHVLFWERVYRACYTSQWIVFWIGTTGVVVLYVHQLLPSDRKPLP